MNLPPQTVLMVLAGTAIYFGVLYLVDRALAGSSRVYFRYAALALSLALFFQGLEKYVDDNEHATGVAKAVVAILAAGAVFYEAHRAGMKQPIAERWKRFVGLALGVAAIVTYFHGFKIGYPRFYHRHDQYHYYMGAKYFRELGYDGLYKCTAIAEDEIGVAEYVDPLNGAKSRANLTKEVRAPDRKIRQLGGDNLLAPLGDLLEHHEVCTSLFTPPRWDAFKEDVKFWRMVSDQGYFEGMQKDHGFNPPPGWIVAGWIFSSMFPANASFNLPILGVVLWPQVLAFLDVFYILGMFAMLYWAFGWRVASVAAVLWGCNGLAPFYWTGGAFLRQDWIFYLVASACFTRKRWFMAAGAAMVYAGMLRIFPGLALIGWLPVAGAYLWKHKRLAKSHQRMLLGGVLGFAVLFPASLAICGKDSYKQFYQHTLKVHDETPLTNHMGLRVLISHNVGSSGSSGRMKYVQDEKLPDPFQVWKQMRNDRYKKYKPVAWAIVLASFVAFAWITRRMKRIWLAGCLGQVFIVLLSQLTNYYYSFIVLSAPLTKAKRSLEIPIFAFCAITQFMSMWFGFFDDRHAALTLVTLLFCYGLMCAFADKSAWNRLVARLRGGDAGEATER